MLVFVCVYMYVCTCMCVHVCMYMYVCTCMCVHVCVYMYVHTYMYSDKIICFSRNFKSDLNDSNAGTCDVVLRSV